MNNQQLISKDEIRKLSPNNLCTLREIYAYCQSNGLKFIAEDKHWIIAESELYDQEIYDMLIRIINDIRNISRHFNDYY